MSILSTWVPEKEGSALRGLEHMGEVERELEKPRDSQDMRFFPVFGSELYVYIFVFFKFF